MTDAIAQVHAGFAGFFKMELHSVDESGEEIAGTRRVVADFPNLITNAGLDSLSGNNVAAYCRLGTGTSDPAVTDTALDSQIAVSPSGNRSVGAPGPENVYSSVVWTYTFAQGAVVGNVGEIGTSPTTSGALFSRARILDGSGSPTTISITDIDILTVTYELRLYIDQTDVLGTVTVDGIGYATVSRPCHMDNRKCENWMLLGVGADMSTGHMSTYAATSTLVAPSDPQPTNPSGTRSEVGVLQGYSPGNHYRDQVFNFSITQGNAAGGVGAVALYNNNNRWALPTQVSFTPALPKDNTKTMTITMRFSWGRYTP